MATLDATNLSTKPVRASGGVHLVSCLAKYTTASGTTLANGDIIRMVKLPLGAEVHYVQLMTEDIDSSTAAVLSVGDTVDDNRYISSSTIGQTGGTAIPNTVAPYFTTTNTSTYINIKVETAPGTQVNDADIVVLVQYSMDSTIE